MFSKNLTSQFKLTKIIRSSLEKKKKKNRCTLEFVVEELSISRLGDEMDVLYQEGDRGCGGGGGARSGAPW